MWRRACFAAALWSTPTPLEAQAPNPAAEAEVARVAQAFLDARLTNDTAAMRRILAEEYTSINSSGVQGDRASGMRLPMNRTPMGVPVTRFAVDSTRIRVYGSTALMTGRRAVYGPDGAMGRGVRFTFLFVHRDDRWQLAASHTTDVQGRR
jgi:uncharacterized protein (TIGR02246 family)